MKAYVLEDIDKLVYKDVKVPEVKEDWTLVKVGAAGICSSDIPRIFEKGTYHFPTIPGHEFSGKVVEVGEKCDSGWIGKKVGVFPLIPCKKCKSCQDGNYEMCENYDYIGSRRDGAFAEYVAVPEWNLLEIPEDASMLEFALLEPLAVALHAVKKAGEYNGKSVNIVGTGMIGIAAALWAVQQGALTVQVIGRNEEKEKLVKQFDRLTYKNINRKEQADEADIVVEAVGSSQSVKEAITLVHPGGTVIFVGNPVGDITLSQDIYWRILRKQLTIFGTWNSSYEFGEKCDWTEARDAIYNKRIDAGKMITHIYGKEQINEGLEMMKNHKESYCKVMTVWDT